MLFTLFSLLTNNICFKMVYYNFFFVVYFQRLVTTYISVSGIIITITSYVYCVVDITNHDCPSTMVITSRSIRNLSVSISSGIAYFPHIIWARIIYKYKVVMHRPSRAMTFNKNYMGFFFLN